MELLSPAGSPEALRAAVEAGADAVYLGWGGFNARRNARNFSDEEAAAALRYCHERGVRVYLTLNTLLGDRELSDALETARRASRLGVDAVLVQDLGLLSLLRGALPELPLHASTQMSLFTAGGLRQAAAAGCTRAVLARECSREDAAACRGCGIEVEVFGHGALCMCYSGQCAMSALIGGRSGNRGLCAQPCRLPYGVDSAARGGHPLSLKDSCLAGDLAAMEELGVACVKLEGRMKRPEYVYVVTEIYARLLREHRGPTSDEREALEQAFSRQGFTDRYWKGGRGPAMFGVRPEGAAEPRELFAAARAAYEKGGLRTVPAALHLTVRAGEAAVLSADDGQGHRVTVAGAVPELARSRAVTAQELEARLQKTGGTAYRCVSARADADEGLSLSAAAVNDLRRRALEALGDARCAAAPRRELAPPPLPEDTASAAEPALSVSLFSLAQLSSELLAQSPGRICLPLEELSAARQLPPYGGSWCAVLPRIWRTRDEGLLARWLTHAREIGVQSVLAGSLGALPLARQSGMAVCGDFGLNVFNARSLDFLRREGLSSACLSFELRAAQIRDMPKSLAAEAIVYGRLPLMITENCLVENACGCGRERQGPCVGADGPCAGRHFLSDRTGARFPLLPAFGHRTEIENCRPLYLADWQDWRRLGLAWARLRFTTETAAECARVLRAYREGAAPQGEFTRGLFDRGVE